MCVGDDPTGPNLLTSSHVNVCKQHLYYTSITTMPEVFPLANYGLPALNSWQVAEITNDLEPKDVIRTQRDVSSLICGANPFTWDSTSQNGVGESARSAHTVGGRLKKIFLRPSYGVILSGKGVVGGSPFPALQARRVGRLEGAARVGGKLEPGARETPGRRTPTSRSPHITPK